MKFVPGVYSVWTT